MDGNRKDDNTQCIAAQCIASMRLGMHCAEMPKYGNETEQGATALGILLPVGAAEAFGIYHELLEKRGKSVNLTAIKGAEDVKRLHFLDSLALLKAAQFENASVIDVGSGAGFPGVPLKIAEPSIRLTLLDSSGKRIAFLTELRAALKLDAELVCARAEDEARIACRRESYDITVSRALARLNVLCELCLPFVRVGGLFLAMKGADAADEINEARGAIEALGAEVCDRFDYTIPGTDIAHSVVVLRKISSTPDKYPRRFARITKAPIANYK